MSPQSAVPFSFELFPPRPGSAASMPVAIDRLAAVGPDFFSVTFRAGGSTRAASLELARTVPQRTSVEVMAHLTCVGTTHAEGAEIVREFLDAGVRRFLAIRGDGDYIGPRDGHLATSAELVQLIHRVQAEREPSLAPPLTASGVPRAAVLRSPHVRVAVAAFLNGHRGSRFQADLDALLAKQAAGADLALTQLFFHAGDYARFVDRARAAGVTIPIVPGILPVTSIGRLRRAIELSGEDLPADLAIRLEVEPTVEGQREVGIEHATALAATVLAAGAPALHLYTFNQADAALGVLHRLGLVPDAAKEPA